VLYRLIIVAARVEDLQDTVVWHLATHAPLTLVYEWAVISVVQSHFIAGHVTLPRRYCSLILVSIYVGTVHEHAPSRGDVRACVTWRMQAEPKRARSVLLGIAIAIATRPNDNKQSTVSTSRTPTASKQQEPHNHNRHVVQPTHEHGAARNYAAPARTGSRRGFLHDTGMRCALPTECFTNDAPRTTERSRDASRTSASAISTSQTCRNRTRKSFRRCSNGLPSCS
jgi:hypothetical protein